MLNFGFSYSLPESETISHTAAWDGSEESNEDGYLIGIQALHRLVLALCKQIEES